MRIRGGMFKVRKPKFLNHRSLYLFLMGSAAFLGMGKSIVFSKIMNPLEFGSYSLLALASTYLTFLMAPGFEPAYMREGSLLFGRKNISRMQVVFNQLISTLLGVALLTSIGLLVFFFILPRLSTKTSFGDVFLNYLAPLTASIALFNLALTYLRVVGNFVKFGFFLFLKNLFTLIIGVFAYQQTSLSGLVASEVISTYVIFLLVLRLVNFSLIRVKISLVHRIIKRSILISLNYLLRTVLISLDRWVVTLSLGIINFGFYSFAMIPHVAFVSFQGIVTQATEPKWISAFGADGSIENLWKKIKKQQAKILIVFCPVVVAGLLVAHPVISRFFPQYVEATAAVRVVLVGSLIHILNFYESIFLIKKSGNLLIRITFFTALITLPFLGLGYFAKLSVLYFALVFLFGRLVSLFLTYFFAKKISKK